MKQKIGVLLILVSKYKEHDIYKVVQTKVPIDKKIKELERETGLSFLIFYEKFFYDVITVKRELLWKIGFGECKDKLFNGEYYFVNCAYEILSFLKKYE